MSETTIADNVAIRQEAEEAFCFVRDLAGAMPEDRAAKFWTIVALRVAEASGAISEDPAPESDKMNTTQAKAFEQTAVTFGKHNGERVGDVPMDYWDFILADTFSHDLRRYMRSDHVQRRAIAQGGET